MKKLLIFGLALLFCFCAQEDQTETKDVVDLVPTDNEISGWTRSSAMTVAEGETQLYALINGAGQVYIDNGFVKSAFQNYVGEVSGNPIVELKLQIFDQGDTTNAKNVYDEVAQGTETPWIEQDHAGMEARYELVTTGFGYYILEFWNDRFYTYIEINDGTQAGLDIAKLFALNIDTAIEDTE
ncbi:MAG: hypothetical protein E3J47_08045 [Candidatus Stahlbacteria bacterium]|nr:MAG: hypothetical protein E3J47_08045 [Candidatus Stahlbacteria bacterium]